MNVLSLFNGNGTGLHALKQQGVSNSQRYKMLGNGWTAEVIQHIFSFLKTPNQ